MSYVIKRIQCPQCQDSGEDNLVFRQGFKTGKCWSCGYQSANEDFESEESVKVMKFISPLYEGGQYRAIKTRGLCQKTCEKMGIRVAKYTGSLRRTNYIDHKCMIFEVYDDNGELTCQKIRCVKDRSIVTQKGNTSVKTMFGQHAFIPDEKYFVTITEGEPDAAAVHEATGYAAVSVRDGCKSAVRDIKANLEWLLKWKYVVLAFDNDEPGQKATQQCLELFKPYQVRVVKMPLKDANEMLMEGRGGEIKNLLWKAQSLVPKSIVQASDVMEDILKKPQMGVSWPWPTLTQATYGIHPKKIYTIGAGSGIGKTELLMHLTEHLTLKEDHKVGGIFLESDAEEVFRGVIGLTQGKRLNVPGREWDEGAIKETAELYNDRLYLFDAAKEGIQGSTWASVKSKIEYMVQGLGMKYIILDHLTALACHMSDERKGLDMLMAELGSLVKSLDFTLFLVSHLSAPPQGEATYEEGRRVTARAFRGSQSIQYWSAFMIGLERNKLAEEYEDRKVTTLRILKDRFSGESDGLTMKLKYNTINGRLEELDEECDEL